MELLREEGRERFTRRTNKRPFKGGNVSLKKKKKKKRTFKRRKYNIYGRQRESLREEKKELLKGKYRLKEEERESLREENNTKGRRKQDV